MSNNADAESNRNMGQGMNFLTNGFQLTTSMVLLTQMVEHICTLQ